MKRLIRTLTDTHGVYITHIYFYNRKINNFVTENIAVRRILGNPDFYSLSIQFFKIMSKIETFSEIMI